MSRRTLVTERLQIAATQLYLIARMGYRINVNGREGSYVHG